jgi:hypothetical protein
MGATDASRSDGAPRGILRRRYRQLGTRYPVVALAVTLRLEHLVLVPGVAFLALYVPMTVVDIVVLSAAAVAAQEVYAALTLRRLRREFEPVAEWLGGERASGQAEAAWRAACARAHVTCCQIGTPALVCAGIVPVSLRRRVGPRGRLSLQRSRMRR